MNWEKEFDKKFPTYERRFINFIYPSAIKSFISDLLKDNEPESYPELLGRDEAIRQRTEEANKESLTD